MAPQDVSRVADVVIDVINSVVDQFGRQLTATTAKKTAKTTAKPTQGSTVPKTLRSTTVEKQTLTTVISPASRSASSTSAGITPPPTSPLPVIDPTPISKSSSSSSSSSKGLSSGAIAGIAVPVGLLAFALIALAIFLIRRKRHRRKQGSQPNKAFAGVNRRSSDTDSISRSEKASSSHSSQRQSIPHENFAPKGAGLGDLSERPGTGSTADLPPPRPPKTPLHGSEADLSVGGRRISRADREGLPELSDTGLVEIDGKQRRSELYEGRPPPPAEMGAGQRWETWHTARSS